MLLSKRCQIAQSSDTINRVTLLCIILKKSLTYFKKSCVVHNAKFLKNVWPFFIILHARVNITIDFVITIFTWWLLNGLMHWNAGDCPLHGLNHLLPMLHFYPLENIRKPYGFLIFPGGAEMYNTGSKKITSLYMVWELQICCVVYVFIPIK